MFSRKRGTRSESCIPSPGNSLGRPPTDTPNNTRPPEKWSNVESCRASDEALRIESSNTAVPSMMRSVAPAARVRSVSGSNKLEPWKRRSSVHKPW